MTAASLFGATRQGALSYMAQWKIDGEVLPGYEDIDESGTFMLRAASEVAVALGRAGHGLVPTVVEDSVAYEYLKSTIEELSALHFASSIAGMMDADTLDAAWGRMRGRIRDIEKGRDIGLLKESDNQRRAIFKHGDTARSVIDARRNTMTRQM